MQKAHHSKKEGGPEMHKSALESLPGWVASPTPKPHYWVWPQPPHLQGVVSLNLHFYIVCYLHTNCYTITLCIESINPPQVITLYSSQS